MNRAIFTSLSPRAKWLLGMHTVFLTGISLSNIFFNVYLWKVYGNIKLAAAFNFFHFLTVPAVFFLGSILHSKLGSLGNLRVGLTVHTFFYLLVLILGQKVAAWYVLLGVLMGTGQGLYYLGYNVSTYDWTNNKNRNHFSGLNGAVSALANLAPLAGGIIIQFFGVASGYKFVFAVAVACFLVAGAISLQIEKDVPKKTAHFWAALKLVENNWLRVSGSMVLRGLREGVMSFALILLIYEITLSEINLGLYNLITSVLTMLTFYMVGKSVPRHRRSSSMLWGAVFLSIMTLVLLRHDLIGLWLFGIANSIIYPYIFVPSTTISYNVIRNNPETREYRIEFLSFREVPLNLGRLMGIALLLLCVRENFSVFWLLWGLGLSQIPLAIVLKPLKM